MENDEERVKMFLPFDALNGFYDACNSMEEQEEKEVEEQQKNETNYF